MKIIVIGGSGLIGKQLVSTLRQQGYDAIPASPSSGVNSVTGEGLTAALAGAQVVVDVSNSPSFEDQAVLEFFRKSTANLLAAERIAGVTHHVALSVVGADRLPDSGYMRAKVAQEQMIQASGIPYTILRATQFFEFLAAIAESNNEAQMVRMPTALLQPVAAQDVARAVADVAISAPANGTLELGGPEAIPLDNLIRRFLRSRQDPREVRTDTHASYFGARLQERDLVPAGNSRRGTIQLDQWLTSTRS